MNRLIAAVCCLGSVAACSQQQPAQHAELSPALAEQAPVSHPPREPDATDVDPQRTSDTSSQPASDASGASTSAARDAKAGAQAGAGDAPANAGANANATDTGRSNVATGSSAPLTPPRSDGPAADNTKRNERDRDSAAVTPVDQGNNESDLKITQQIRQAVMSDNSLSFNAKNAKIITVNGKVTLRGAVASDAERTAIGNAATRVVGPTHVENLLEVKK
jgi:osmotically-inducible protein OsmY